MLIKAAPFMLVLVSLAMEQRQETDIAAMIKRLGSKSFREREEATAWLQQREEAAPRVPEALRSADKEVAKRAALILDHYDRRPLRDVQAAARQGDVDRLVQLLAGWPEGKREEAALAAVREMGKTLLDLTTMLGGQKIEAPRCLTQPAFLIVIVRGARYR